MEQLEKVLEELMSFIDERHSSNDNKDHDKTRQDSIPLSSTVVESIKTTTKEGSTVVELEGFVGMYIFVFMPISHTVVRDDKVEFQRLVLPCNFNCGNIDMLVGRHGSISFTIEKGKI